jgi:hypothetical protein
MILQQSITLPLAGLARLGRGLGGAVAGTAVSEEGRDGWG